MTPWKEELLWRLYVETYNHLTLGYGDELVPQDPAGLAVVIAGRPDDISELELTEFLAGLPRRYLALFGLASIYRHVRLARGIRRDEVHAFLENHDDVWELTIVTLDKPYLFSERRRGPVVFRHGHSSRTGDDHPRRPRPRRVRVLRRAGVPQAEPRGDPGDHPDARSRGGGLGGRAGAAARARVERALPPAVSPSRRGCTSTTNTRRSTRFSKSSQTMPPACFTASAGWYPSKGATSTWR